MPGILGGEVDETHLSALADLMIHEAWYEVEQVSRGPYSLGLVHHGAKDELGDVYWQRDGVIGVLHGVVTAGADMTQPGEFFESVLERPVQRLRSVDGLFTLAVVDSRRGRTVIATDKIGSRPCYYTTENGLLFASEVKALVDDIEEPIVDRQAVSDLLMLGAVWGDKTLVGKVNELRPARVLTHERGDVSIDRYWRPPFSLTPRQDYVDDVLSGYRQSVRSVAATAGSGIRLWLSGGLDSRILAAVLREVDDSVRTMTYNIPGQGESKPAVEVATTLGMENETIELGPAADFAGVLEYAISLTDGMLAWNYFINTSYILRDMKECSSVVFEGAPQDTFLGHDLWNRDRRRIRETSVTDALYRRHRRMDEETIRDLRGGEIRSPKQSIRDETKLIDDDPVSVFRDVTWQSLAYSHLRSSNVPRSQVGTRVACQGTPFLSAAARRPASYNRQTVPFTRIPQSTTRIKFELIRKLDDGLDEIDYQLTGLPPTYPQWVQTIGMGIKELRKRLEPSFGVRDWLRAPDIYGDWYRNDPEMRRYLNDLLDGARTRPYFDEDAVSEVRDAHLADEANHTNTIAAITTVESWRRQHLD